MACHRLGAGCQETYLKIVNWMDEKFWSGTMLDPVIKSEDEAAIGRGDDTVGNPHRANFL